jgi:hypothetical protein
MRPKNKISAQEFSPAKPQKLWTDGPDFCAIELFPFLFHRAHLILSHGSRPQ